MPSFTNTFGGTNIYPSDVSYRAISLSASTTLEWPTEVATGTNVAASIMDVTASSAGLTIRMPPADETSVGQTALFFNPGANAFTVADNSGNVITVVAAGESWQVYITDNTTAAGSWRTVEYGAGTSAPAAGALAGKGIKAITTTLNQSMPVFSYPIIPGTYSYTLDEALRAGTVLWDSGSTGTLTLAAASTNGSDWFCHIRNNGAGSVILNCTGGDQINGLSSLTFGPGDSATLICDGNDYFTIGQGNASTSGILAFDYVALDLTGASSPYILQGVELNRVSYNFIGALTSNMEIVVPLNLQQYWVKNSTSGPHTLVVKTASGGGVQVQQGYAQILYCNGVNVVAANDPPGVTDIPVSAGGIYVDNFSGNGLTQIFNLSFAVTNEDRTQVYINGVYQQKNTYTVSGATLTFSSPPPSGTNNIEVVSLGAANYPASSVLFTPYGNLTSTNVQDAIEEEIDDLAASSGSSLIGFIQSGTGATARTAQSKMRDTVSVKDFGAVGDGVTDDTAAIQAAITSLATIGGMVFVPRGTYKIASTISIPGRVCLMGEPSGGLTHPSYSAVIFSYTGTNSACITHASPYRNAGIHNILIKCNSGANTTGVKFPSALYGNYSNLYVMDATVGYDMTSAAGTDGIIFNELRNIGGRNCATGLIIDGTLAAHSANQIGIGVFLLCNVAVLITECGSTTLVGERGEIGNNATGINMTGGIVTLDGEFWMEFNSTADIVQTGGLMTIAKPFRSLGKIQTSLPGVMLSSNNITPYKVLPSLSINRGIVNNAYSFRSFSDVTDVMGAQNLTLVNGAVAETTYRTKFGSGIEFLNTASRRMTLPAGYFRFDNADWCLGFLVKLAPATGVQLFKLEGSDPNLDRLSFTLAYNQNYGQFLKTENGVSGSVTGFQTSYEWFTDDYPHWFFVAYDSVSQKLLSWEPNAGMTAPNVTPVPLAYLGANVQLTVGQAGQYGTFALDEMILFNKIPDNYTLQAIARSNSDLKSMLA